jgi:hypothetical protein
VKDEINLTDDVISKKTISENFNLKDLFSHTVEKVIV